VFDQFVVARSPEEPHECSHYKQLVTRSNGAHGWRTCGNCLFGRYGFERAGVIFGEQERPWNGLDVEDHPERVADDRRPAPFGEFTLDDERKKTHRNHTHL
jgi:hypothetical protein